MENTCDLILSYVSTEGEYIKMFMRGRPITMFIPSNVDNYDDIRTELPPEKLKLEWVYPSQTREQTYLICPSLIKTSLAN